MEPYTPGFDVWSLVQLLEDMRRAAEAFGRSEIEGLFDASRAPSYEGELRDFLVESMWKNVGDVDSSADRLRARQIKEDIKGLRDATEDVKRYADLVIAHNTRQKPAPMPFSVVSSATDEVVRIAKRYTATLTGASMLSFAPVDQFNWYDVVSLPVDRAGLRRSGCCVNLVVAYRYAAGLDGFAQFRANLERLSERYERALPMRAVVTFYNARLGIAREAHAALTQLFGVAGDNYLGRAVRIVVTAHSVRRRRRSARTSRCAHRKPIRTYRPSSTGAAPGCRLPG